MNGKTIGWRGRTGALVPTISALALATFVSLMPRLASASEAFDADMLSFDRAAVDASDQLLSSLRQWERSPAAERAARMNTLAQLAQRRQERLLALMERNPRLAVARMLPRSLRERLPAQAAIHVEQDTTLQGSVHVRIADDFASGTSHRGYRFAPADGSAELELHFADVTVTERDISKWLNRRVALTGLRVGEHLALADKGTVQLLASGAATSSTSSTSSGTATTTPSNPVVQGDQKTLVILANFSDVSVPCTAADLQARLFATGGSTMNEGYLESSGGLVSFSGRVIGPFRISYASTGSCDPNAWSTAIDSAARAAGVEPSAYMRVSYAMPKNANCGWNGLASLGGPLPTPSWIQACTSTGVFSHELGHNLNFEHASTPTSEYGDYTDPMGAAMLVQSNPANRVMAGWMPAGQILDVAIGGSYALSALEVSTPTSPRVLRLPKPDTAETYYVGMRQLTGVDANLIAGYQNMVTIHRANGVMPTHTYLMAYLSPGQSWTDPVNAIQVVHQGISGTTATVGISLGAPTCSQAAPSLAIAPVSQTGAAGTALAYKVSVTNRNSAACASSTFSLSQTLPAGLSGAFTTPALTLAPGATAASNWSVASAATVGDATYPLTANVVDSNSGLSASAPASDIVYTAPTCTRSAPLMSVLPSTQSGALGTAVPYTITLTNRDSPGCASSTFKLGQSLPDGFSGVFGTSSLSIAPGASANNTWRVTASSGAGTYTLTVNATDIAASTVAQAQATETIIAAAAADTLPPTVTLTNPIASANLAGRSIAMAANASDASGIASVAFYVDGILLSTDSSAPYAANWNLRKAKPGAHTVKVRATDRAGNYADQSVAVTVN